MTPCPRCGRTLAALARRGLDRRRDAAIAIAPWLGVHLGDGGTSDCRITEAEAAMLVDASGGADTQEIEAA